MSPDDPNRTVLARRSLLVAGGVLGLGLGSGAVVPAFASPVLVQPGPPGEDSAPAIQEAIDLVAAAGGTVMLTAGTFSVGSTIRLASDVTLRGAGRDRTRLVDHTNLGAAPLLSITGTADASVARVTIADLALRNGTASTQAYLTGRDGVVVDHAARIAFEQVRVTEIAGANGIIAERTTGLSITGSHFHRCTYSMVIILPDCTDVSVTNCEFVAISAAARYASSKPSNTSWTPG